MFRKGALRASGVLVVVVMLGACAGTQHKSAKIAPASQAVAGQRGDAKGYRFNMTQHGKKMSAEDFDAWMKANGLHVAQGKAKPAAKRDAKAAVKAKPKAKPEKVVAATAKKKPSRD